MIVVDTVRASHSRSEDSSEDVSAYLRAARRIAAAAPGAALVLVHHAGWPDGESAKKRERGSSAFRGNVDYSHFLETVADDPEARATTVELRTLKVKDGAKPTPLGLRVRTADIGGCTRVRH